MQLKNLLESIGVVTNNTHCEIKGLTLNSKAVKPSVAFIAVPGHLCDGRDFIQEAVERKAAVILAEAKGLNVRKDIPHTHVPIIPIDNLSDKLGFLASSFYQKDKKKIITVGITGTNGKTTCSFLISQALHKLGAKSALMGTLGYGLIGQDLKSQNLTTPDPISLHQNYATLIEKGAEAITLEVSSHGLAQNRLNGLCINSAIFTNLTQDHLDYHRSMDDYLKSKRKLFERSELERVVINLESPYCDKILENIDPTLPIYFYSSYPPKRTRSHFSSMASFVYAREYALHNNGISAHIVTPWGEGELRSPLMGDFNLSNLLAVVTEICCQGYPLKAVLSALYTATGAPGRMQRLGRGDLPEVIVDYAHTPDALEKALLAARQHCKRRLWVVFGCGGGRDKDKRKKMGDVAARLADKLILTNDNPRLESPRQIINDIMQDIPLADHKKILIEMDRKKAIQYAIAHGLSVDTILIAGKGHEDYQDMGRQRIPFNDVACVESIFSQGG